MPRGSKLVRPESRTVVVCGASRGLGKKITESLLDEGSGVIAVARNEERLAENEGYFRSINPSIRLKSYGFDMSLESGEQQLSEVLSEEGSVDGLMVTIGNGRPQKGSGVQNFQESIERNVYPVIRSFMASADSLQKSPLASVVFVSSIVAHEFINCPAEYAAAKSSIEVLAKHWAREFSPLRINVVAPGNIRTEGSVWALREKEAPGKLRAWLNDEVPLARLAEPEEVAESVLFLLSARSSFINGSTLTVDGGQKRSFS